KAGINVRPQEVVANSAPVTALVGEVAPFKAPSRRPDPDAQASAAKTSGGPRRRRGGGNAGNSSSGGSARGQHRNSAGRRRSVSR
ncbi:MAG: ATP-dependent helicase, partial [Mycobacterium sp.]